MAKKGFREYRSEPNSGEGPQESAKRECERRRRHSRPTPDAIDAVSVVRENLLERGSGEFAIGGREDVRDAGAGEFVARLWPPNRLFVPVLHLTDAAVPFEDFDVLVRDRFEVHVEGRPG